MMNKELKHVILGLDIGKKTDHTVLVVLEKWQPYSWDFKRAGHKKDKYIYHLVHMDRLPLDTPHTVQIDHVTKATKRIESIYDGKPYLVIDTGSVGESHFDAYKEAFGQWVYGISIHGGQGVTYSKRVYGVPKVDLTSALSILLENGRLQIADDLPGRDVLIKELMTFSWKQTETGHFKFEHLKSGDHDDTVLALQVACWFGEKGIRELTTFKKPSGM